MSAFTLSPELADFLKTRLSSADQIDIVLLLRRDGSRSWSAPEVAKELRTPPESSAMRLFLLASGGLVVFEPASTPRYRYSGGDPVVESYLRELDSVWAEHRAEVLRAVDPSGPDPIRSFADAFKLRK